MAGRPTTRRLAQSAVVPQGMPPTLPQMPQAAPVQVPAPPGLEGVWDNLPDEQKQALSQAWQSYAPPPVPTYSPINMNPQGAMEGMAQSLGPHPFQMPQGYMRGGPGGSFLVGLASGFGNALTSRGAANYQTRIGQQVANQQAQKAAYDAQVAENKAGRAMVGQRALTVATAAGGPTDDTMKAVPATPDFIKWYANPGVNVGDKIPNSVWQDYKKATSPQPMTATDRTAALQQKNAGAVARGLANYSLPPTIIGNRLSPQAADVYSELEKIPEFKLQQATAQFNNAKKFMDSENGSQMINRRNALVTIGQHIKTYEDGLKELDALKLRSPYKQANRWSFTLARQGLLGPEATAIVTSLENTARTFIGPETANAVSGSSQIAMEDRKTASQVYDMLYGPAASGRGIKMAKDLIVGRARAMQAATPWAGGKSNPYLIQTSPLTVLGKVLKGEDVGDPDAVFHQDSSTPSAPTTVGKSYTYDANGNLVESK